MKSITLLLALFAFLNVNAQTTEKISHLTPVASNIGNFTKNVPKDRYAVLSGYKIKFKTTIEPVNLANGTRTVAIVIILSTSDIVFTNMGGQETSIVRIYGRITSNDEKTDGFFEEMLTTTVEAQELIKGSVKPVILRKVFELPDGKYQIGVIVRDSISGAQGVKIVKFQIPQTENIQK